MLTMHRAQGGGLGECEQFIGHRENMEKSIYMLYFDLLSYHYCCLSDFFVREPPQKILQEYLHLLER